MAEEVVGCGDFTNTGIVPDHDVKKKPLSKALDLPLTYFQP